MRLGLTVVLLGSLVLRWLTVGQAQVAERERFTLIAVLVCAAMGLSAIGLNRRVDVHRVAWLQLAMDCAAITAVTLLTKGASSVFGGLYVLSVVGSAYLVDGRGSLLVAAVYATILGLMGVWQGWEVVNLGTPERLPGLISDVAIRVMGFFLAALLAGKLTERLRAAEEQLDRQASRTYTISCAPTTATTRITEHLPARRNSCKRCGNSTTGRRRGMCIPKRYLISWRGSSFCGC